LKSLGQSYNSRSRTEIFYQLGFVEQQRRVVTTSKLLTRKILCFTAVSLAVSHAQKNISWFVQREKNRSKAGNKSFGTMRGLDRI
jgi:hypothetical protein